MKEVPSDHRFFDETYVKEWTARALRKAPGRKIFLDAFVSETHKIGCKNASVLELGPGPGFLAEALLEHCDISSYILFDISPHMIDLGRSRLSRFSDRTTFIQGDFKKDLWVASVPTHLDLVVSMQAIHELRHAAHIPKLYSQVHQLLASGGVFMFSDHVNSRLPAELREAHFMTVSGHISTLKKAGFTAAEEILAAGDMSFLRGRKG